jgi:hypothetical protein
LTVDLPAVVDLEGLVQRILDLRSSVRINLRRELLAFKWLVGKEISEFRLLDSPTVRVQWKSSTYLELSKQVGIRDDELVRCVQFYQKYPNQDYELRPWRRIIAELPVVDEDQVYAGDPPGATTILGDFREVGDQISSGSISLMFTDPPYGKEWLPNWGPLGKMASRVLKEGGYLVTYGSQPYLPAPHGEAEKLDRAAKHLEDPFGMGDDEDEEEEAENDESPDRQD